MVDKVEALDKYTVKFTLREPNAWFVDRLASTSTWIIAKECVDQYGDLKKPESVVGTGPWMFQSYEPNVRMTFVRNPNYFVPGLPYADGVDITISTDPAAAFAQFLVRRVRLRPGVRHGDPPQRPRHRAPARQGARHAGLHRGVRRLHRDEARPGAVQGRAGAPGLRDGPGLAGDARDQCLVAGQGRAEPAHPGRAQGVVDPDRPAPRGGAQALRVRPRRGQAAARRGRPSQRPQGPGRDHARLRAGLDGRGAGGAPQLEAGRDRGATSSSRSTAPSSRARSSASSRRAW